MIEQVLRNKNFGANLVFFLIIVGIAADMAFPGPRSTLELDAPNRMLCHLIQLAIVFVMFVYAFYNYTLPRTRAVMVWEVSLYVFLSLTLYYAVFSDRRSQLIVFAKMAAWPVGYFFFRVLGNEVKNYGKKLTYLLLCLCVFAVWFYVRGAEFRARFAVNSVVVGSNVAWDLLYIFLISLCLSSEGDRKGYFLGVAVLFIVPLTLKRGAILAEFAICLSLLVAGHRLGILQEFLRKCLKWCVVGLTAWFLVYATRMGAVAGRFSGLTEDGGSGRSEFYRLLYDRWREADLFNWLFGFGFWSTPEYLSRTWINSVYAHSDVLEVLHDYGLLGIVVYGLILLGSFLICVHTWKMRSPGMFIAFSVFSLFFVKGLISGNIMFRQTMYLTMPLGYMVGKLESTGLAWGPVDQSADAYLTAYG